MSALFLIHSRMQAEREREAGEAQAGAPARSKENFVSLEEDETERYGLKTESARSVHWYPHVSVHGRIIANPQATSEIRSPFAGMLRAPSGAAWPVLGQRVRAGQTLGRVDVRVGPEVRLDLQNKLSEASIRRRGAEEEVKLQQDRVNSLKAVTSQQIISRVELDAALVQLAQARNQLATAQAATELWQKALSEVERRKGDARSPWSQPLVASADGEVTDLLARPGMMVEAGSPILVLVDFRRPLVRLDIPPELLALGGPPRQVEVRPSLASLAPVNGILDATQHAESTWSAEASLAGAAPRVDAASQFVSYWYEVQDNTLPPRSSEAASALWRPGMHVMAEMRAEGAAQAAVSVPAGAVLYHDGRPLVYVRVGPERFQRREVRLLGREGDRWILSTRQGELAVGVMPGEDVVARQGQVLLSKEFLAGSADND
jgi:multidrug efflux pump subunit AcrA (membrane-fusion protein)